MLPIKKPSADKGQTKPRQKSHRRRIKEIPGPAICRNIKIEYCNETKAEKTQCTSFTPKGQ